MGMPSWKVFAQVRVALVLASCGSLAACNSMLEPHANYVNVQSIGTKIVGAARIEMAKNDREMIITAYPRSFTGFVRTATVPLGAIAETVGEQVNSRFFTGGVASPGERAYIIEIKPEKFRYKFDQFKYVGLEVTPMVSVSLAITIKNADGAIIVPERVYTRANVDMGAYFFPTHPIHMVNWSLHEAIKEMYLDALKQIPRSDPL